MRIPPIRTQRLLLRRPRLADADAVVPLLHDRTVSAFIPLIPYPYRRRDWLAFIGKQQGGPVRRPEGLSFPLVIEKGGTPVGMIGMRWDAKERSANIGYWIGKPYRRQGIATEAARAVCGYAFSKLRAERVWATVLVGNPGSPKVLQHCGMGLEGVLRSHLVHRGRRFGEAHYAVLRSEWRRKRR